MVGGLAALSAFSNGGQASAVDLKHTNLKDVHEIQYDVMWHEEAVGKHRILLEPADESLLIQHDTEIEVSVLFITALSLHQTTKETWRAGSLQKVSSSTVRNDAETQVEGERVGDTFVIQSQAGAVKSEPDIATVDSFWLLSSVQHSKLLDTRNVQIHELKKADLGERKFVVAGEERLLTGYHIDFGDTHADLWYEGDFLTVSDVKEDGKIAHIQLGGIS